MLSVNCSRQARKFHRCGGSALLGLEERAAGVVGEGASIKYVRIGGGEGRHGKADEVREGGCVNLIV